MNTVTLADSSISDTTTIDRLRQAGRQVGSAPAADLDEFLAAIPAGDQHLGLLQWTDHPARDHFNGFLSTCT